MRCCHCGEKEATKTYERRGKERKIEYYCMDCYDKLFLNAETAGESSLSSCPYCGMSLTEFQSTKLVGCAHCYRTMKGGVYPVVVKMQGDGAHTGKTPPVSEDGKSVDLRDLESDAYEDTLQKERFKRQCNELEIIIAKLKAENNYEDAKDYADKLSLMRSNVEIEEEFVWRTRRTLSKQP
ncbi:MAG: hypothetical protein IJX30_00400 [Clostridia bacterium]|nr:hypothetical protein [Clostridia bacterium]